MSNNYKDAAQQDLKRFGDTLEKMIQDRELGKWQISYYQVKLSQLTQSMKNFTHKNQKVRW